MLEAAGLSSGPCKEAQAEWARRQTAAKFYDTGQHAGTDGADGEAGGVGSKYALDIAEKQIEQKFLEPRWIEPKIACLQQLFDIIAI